MRRRPSSRLLVIDRNNRVLLFRFVFSEGPLAGKDYWATPGGALEPGESFAGAARRELFEETGILNETIGPEVARREFVLQLQDGEHVAADERFFPVRVDAPLLSRDHMTAIESQTVTDHHWWSVEELGSTRETILPEDLLSILAAIQALESLPQGPPKPSAG